MVAWFVASFILLPSSRSGFFPPKNMGWFSQLEASEVCVQSCCVIVVMTSVVVLWPRERGLCSRKDRCWLSCRIRYPNSCQCMFGKCQPFIFFSKTFTIIYNICIYSVKRQCMSTYSANLDDSYELRMVYILWLSKMLCFMTDATLIRIFFSAKLVFGGVIPMQTAPWTAMLEIWYVASAELGEWSGMRLKTTASWNPGGWVRNFSWSIFCVAWVWAETAVDVRFTSLR